MGYNLSKWFGVNGSCEFMSIVIGVRGLELIIDSASSKNVCNWLSFNSCSPESKTRIRRMVLIILCQLPPMWLALGGLNVHCTSRCSE